MDYNLSDIRAATGGEMDGFGGGWMWIIVLFLFLFGAGGNGFGGNRSNEIQQGFDTAEITRKLDGLANGLCDGFYAQNTTMLNGFAGITTAVRDAQFAAQQCCCETNRNIDAVRYEAAQNTCAIEKAIHAEGEATRAMIDFAHREFGVRDFQASHAVDNPASGRVMEKVGCRFDRLSQYSTFDGAETFPAKVWVLHLPD